MVNRYYDVLSRQHSRSSSLNCLRWAGGCWVAFFCFVHRRLWCNLFYQLLIGSTISMKRINISQKKILLISSTWTGLVQSKNTWKQIYGKVERKLEREIMIKNRDRCTSHHHFEKWMVNRSEHFSFTAQKYQRFRYFDMSNVELMMTPKWWCLIEIPNNFRWTLKLISEKVEKNPFGHIVVVVGFREFRWRGWWLCTCALPQQQQQHQQQKA